MGSMKNETKEGKILAFEEYKKKKKKNIQNLFKNWLHPFLLEHALRHPSCSTSSIN